MNQQAPITLASGSPRRSELLDLMGIRFTVCVTDTDESRLAGELPRDFVVRLARAKAAAGLAAAGGGQTALGADTIVLLGSRILGKPQSRSDAREMLTALSGQTHQVLSAVAVAQTGGGILDTLNTTDVTFSEIPPSFIEDYCQTDDPMDKAGAYAVQGRTALYISRINGSYSGVMGLPLYETGVLLRHAGVIA